MNITAIAIRRPVFAWMIMAATVLFGLVSFTRIGVSQFPDVDFPMISVRAEWEGAAPEIMETEVLESLEEALVQVEGIRSITSSAQQGSARITLELDIDRDVDVAMQDVQARVAQAQRRLPADVDPPVVSKSNPEDQPIMWVALSGPYPQRVLSDYARYQVREKLQTVPGVGELLLGGYLERNVRIWLDAARLDSYGLTVNDIMAALRRQHIELPAGRLESGGQELNVRVLGEAIDLEEFRRIVVRQTNGVPIYLEDVALVEDGFEDQRRMARVDGVPAQGIGIKKQRGANAVAVSEGIRNALEEISQTLPEGMKLGINSDTTRFIKESVEELQFELVLSIFLTAIICWLFLGSLSSTLNVLLAIPMSLLGTVAVVYFLGYTFNTFTLLGLALAVGLVVDDAIMVLENVYRHAEEGKPRAVAALEGTDQIKFPALAATISVIAIFLPVVFMEGIVGRYFLQFGVTLCAAILFSYLEAITLAPARLAQWLDTSREGRSRFGRLVDSGFSHLERVYRRVLDWGLTRPLTILGMAAAVFAGSLWLVTAIPSEFVPSQDQSRLMVRVKTAIGSSLAETDHVFKQAEEYVNNLPEVDRAFAVVGGWGGEVNQGMMFVTLLPPDQREPQAAVATKLRRELNAIAGLRAVVSDDSQRGFSARRGFPIEFSVRGPDWNRLVELSQAAQQKLAASGMAVDVDSNYDVGMPEVRIVPKRALAADLGVPVEDVATTLSAMVGGMRVGKYSTDGRRLDVRMRLLAEQRSRPEDLERLHVRSSNGTLIPLSTLVSFEERPALQAITREDRERAVSVYANVAPGHSQAEVMSFVEGMQKEMPTGYRLVFSGSSVAFQESMDSLLFALILGVVFAYMVLASQFNSFLHPLTVLTVLPLSAAGAIFALWVSGNTLNIFSMIGLLLLLGIVTKNSIILVDYANIERQRGLSALDAMRSAGPIRLRPILMTSMATLSAAVPASLGLGPGSETRAPMALGIIGGLSVATVLSLLVVPAFYVTADRVITKLRGKKAAEVQQDAA